MNWDDEVVDLDAVDVTGDPALDQLGYQSPKRDFTPPRQEHDWLAQARRDAEQRQQRRRDAVEENKADTRRRNAERRNDNVAPDLPPHAAAAVERGAPGRAAGWWRVEVGPDGARWTKVDQPDNDGNPRIMAAAPRPRRRWWQRRRPEEPQPSPGTVLW